MTPRYPVYAARMLDAARVSLLVTAAALPFSTAATNIFAALAFLLWALSGQWRATLHVILAEPALWLGYALLAALCVGVAWSRAPTSEAFGAVLKYRELALFGIVAFLFVDERWRQRLLWIFFASALLLLCLSFGIRLGVFSYIDARGFSSAQNAVLLRSGITHSFIMSLLAYGSAVVALRCVGWQRWALGIVALLAAINVWFAVQGRTGYLMLAVLLIWLAYLRWSTKGLVGMTVALTLLLGSAYQWSPAFHKRIGETVEQASDYREGAQNFETSIGMRLHLWKRSAQWMTAHRLLGAGTGGWGEAFYQATEGDGPFMHNRDRDHPHNEYIHFAVQLGPLGLLLFVALLVVAFRRAARLLAAHAALAQGFVLAFAVGCLFNDFMWDNTEGHMWAILGGALFGAAPHNDA